MHVVLSTGRDKCVRAYLSYLNTWGWCWWQPMWSYRVLDSTTFRLLYHSFNAPSPPPLPISSHFSSPSFTPWYLNKWVKHGKEKDRERLSEIWKYMNLMTNGGNTNESVEPQPIVYLWVCVCVHNDEMKGINSKYNGITKRKQTWIHAIHHIYIYNSGLFVQSLLLLFSATVCVFSFLQLR